MPFFNTFFQSFFHFPKHFNGKPLRFLCYSGFVGAFILPHGALLLDPERLQNKDTMPIDAAFHSKNLQNGMKYVADVVVNKIKPDLILLLTPHGISNYYNWNIYLNSKAKGDALWEKEYSEYKIDDLLLARDESLALLSHLKNDKNCNVEGLSTYSNYGETVLRWGEVIPLYYIHQESKDHKIPVIIMHSSYQVRSKPNDIETLKDITNISKNICNYFENEEQFKKKKNFINNKW